MEYGTGFVSRWKCAFLPILWKLQSDLFPTNNSADVAISIASVADNGQGLAEFTTSSNHLLLRFDWVNITSSTVEAYEGIAQIIAQPTSLKFVLNIPFTATATGLAKKYYNNYNAIIEVYGGLPSGHEFEAEDPSELTTSVKVFFDSDNIAVVDLSRIGQTLINNIFDNNIISWPNVLNFWDQTEILLKESFDQSDGTDVTTLERYACIKDGGFVTGADWSNEGTGASWTFGSDQANVSLDEAGDNDSKELTQTIQGDALARFSITVTLTFTHTSGTPTVRLRATIGGTTVNVQGSTTSQLTLTKTVTGLTADDTGVFSLEADITVGSGSDTVDIVVDDVAVCIGLANKVVNSKLDFRNGRGGNMFDYIARSVTTKAKFMTGFVRPTIFIDKYFSMSVIIEDFTGQDPRLAIQQESNTGVQVAPDIITDIDGQGLGVYQLRIDQLGISTIAKVLQIAIIDNDQFGAGNWEAMTDQGATDIDSLIMVTRLIICTEQGAGITRSDDGGATWAQATAGAGGAMIELDYDPEIDIAVALSSADDVFVSEDLGATWAQKTDTGLTAVTGFSIGGGVIYAGGSVGTVKKSLDFGASWTSINIGASVDIIIAIFALTGQKAWTVPSSSGNEIFKTSNGGSTWTTQTTGSTTFWQEIYFFDENNGILVGLAGVVNYTVDGGDTWQIGVSGIANNFKSVWMQDSLLGFACSANGDLIKTEDGGATWAAESHALGAISLNSLHGIETTFTGRTLAIGADDGESEKFDSEAAITEIVTADYDQGCANQEIYLMWLNQFGGWDFWKFNAEKDYGTEFTDSQRTEKNIYDNWPQSYNSESLNEEARVKGFQVITVRSQHLTAEQADLIGGIKKSMNVIWVKEGLTLSDNVTVLVDKNSFQRFNETDQLHTITFTLRQTDDIATQSN